MVFYFILKDGDREYPSLTYASTDLEKVRRKATSWDVIYKYEGDTFEFDEDESLDNQPGYSIFEGTIEEYFTLDDYLKELENLHVDWDKFDDSDYPYETDYEITYKDGKIVKNDCPNFEEIIRYIKENCLYTPKEYKTVYEVIAGVMSEDLSKADAFDMIRNMLSCENSK